MPSSFSLQKMLITIFLTIGGIAFISGCEVNSVKNEHAVIQKAVLEALTDPDSAKFKDITVVQKNDGRSSACVTVNSKNRMGGYTGYRQVMLYQSKDRWILETDQFMNKMLASLSHDDCVSVLKK